ncbi:class I SAM-dependent methyltransferase [Paenactinomyces guangxiensis]|uniref:Methyltransferase domain-containing protein n=1 Tax=Paenactinomyces guangxiensis TaxID=1490290 RepID=A0A7W2A7U4_9BACL|nr:class I SAM-dependent methyltransferase [Paenactinomyces guangxiensis]MBA4493472.1 methyltransferase domain-containing protein [Paenactinomyces guangxiensis]MBH8590563.1 methyltransferase domain-containing protein [Paenactinomyces guangxiensis]
MSNIVKQTIEYFSKKASQYDLVESQNYWRLSDKLLWEIFNRMILSKLPSNFVFFDAGGGTGRWSLKILEEYPEAKGFTYDISEDMLNQARLKQKKHQLYDRWEIRQGDLHHIEGIKKESVDVCFNFHNVIGFVENPSLVISKLNDLVKPGGFMVTLAPNLYHAIYFNLSLGKIEEAIKAVKGKGRFTEDMPYIHLFSPEQLRNIYTKNNLKIEKLVGFPSFIYPGFQETQLTGETQKIADILSVSDLFERVFELELQFMSDEATVARGNNLFIIGRKNEG